MTADRKPCVNRTLQRCNSTSWMAAPLQGQLSDLFRRFSFQRAPTPDLMQQEKQSPPWTDDQRNSYLGRVLRQSLSSPQQSLGPAEWLECFPSHTHLAQLHFLNIALSMLSSSPQYCQTFELERAAHTLLGLQACPQYQKIFHRPPLLLLSHHQPPVVDQECSPSSGPCCGLRN
jgi:hypothetical protein